MDLEWNNTYSRKKKSFFNEIIEIGAVMLDDNLNEIGTFSQVIKSQVGKKLRSSVKKLTNITNEEVRTGELFTKTFSEFRKWIGKDENTFFTWGDSDLRVLTENFRYLNGIQEIPFINNYCDLQKCFQKITGGSSATQTGLNNAALQMGLNPDDFSLHRALDDSMLTSMVLRKIYNKEIFIANTETCTHEFYEKLFFKARVISNIDNPIVDKSMFTHSCEKCGKKCSVIDEWKYHNQFFRAVYFCKHCDTYYKVGVRFKKYYDHVDVRKISSVFDPKLDNKQVEAEKGDNN